MTDRENRLAEMVASQFAEIAAATGGSGGGGGDNPFAPSSGYKEVTLRSGFGYTRTTLRSGCVSSWSMGFPIYTDDATIAVGDKVIVKGTATDDGTPFAVWGEVNSVRERSGYFSLIITVEGSSIREDSASVVDVNSNGQTLIFGATEVHVAVPPYGEGNMDISANGPYNVSGKASVIVDVPNSYGAADEGKVVSSGALVAQTTQNIAANGTYDTTDKNEVVVNVPNSYSQSDEGKVVSSGALIAQTSQNISANGTYNTTEKNEVVVNVPNSYSQSDEGKVVSSGALIAQTSENISANGTYDTTAKNEVVVDVPDYVKWARLSRYGQSSGTVDITDDDLPTNMTGITAYGFYYKTALHSFTSKTQIRVVENYAFQYARGLISVELLNIGSIKTSTFNGCTALKSASFGNIVSIEVTAFSGCTALEDVFFDCESVPTLSNTNAFRNVPETCTFWVPDDLVDSFKAADNWSSFASQIKPVSEYEGE